LVQPPVSARVAADDEIVKFDFVLVPAHKPEELHDNIRSSTARNLPVVKDVLPHDEILSVVGGGPSLEDTYGGLTGYVAAINGSLSFLLDKGIIPQMCGVCDPSPHMVDIVEADKRVTYFLASIVHPSVYDKLLDAGCLIYRWNITVPGWEEMRAELEPDSTIIGGGSTMGLRWLNLGYAMGFRRFHLHGYDSSFRIDPRRGKASHAYKDHQDEKEWVTFDGYATRVNFIGQLKDFIDWMDRLTDDDVDPVEIKVHGDGLLQSKFKEWQAHNPGWHTESLVKPRSTSPSAGFKWPEADQQVRSNTLSGVRYMKSFLRLVPRKGTVVQAGGNVGVYPVHLAQHFQRVHTFEPDPTNYRLMIENLKGANGIRAYNAALGAEDGTCGLVQPDPTNTGDIRVTGSGDVPMRTIDDMGLEECDLIWLDTEGTEELILKGAEQTIDRCRPCVIIEENGSPKHHGLEIDGARKFLEERDYYFALRHERDTLMVPR
jgi:FkbM family methyltransferase